MSCYVQCPCGATWHGDPASVTAAYLDHRCALRDHPGPPETPVWGLLRLLLLLASLLLACYLCIGVPR